MPQSPMPKPKDPSDQPVSKAPTEASSDAPTPALEGQSLETMIEVLATATAQMQGLKGSQLKDTVRELVREVQNVARDVENKAAADESRKAATAEVERLVDVIARSSQQAAKALDPHRKAIAAMFRSVDFEKMSLGLKLINDYLNDPDTVTEQQIKKLLGEMQATMGPMVGYDPEREEAQQREEIRKDVQARLDKIFKKPEPK